MFKEAVHFIRYAPAASRRRRELGPTATLDDYEARLDAAGKNRWRAAIAEDLTGEVLEIGAGTGLMLPFYPRTAHVTLTDPDEACLALAATRVPQAAAAVILRPASGEELPFPDGSFDAVVSAGVLCSVRSVEGTLAQVRRVLRPGGEFRLLEHVRSDRFVAGLLMDAFNPVWLRLNGTGCRMNRNVEAALEAAGFALRRVERFQVYAEQIPTAFPYRAIWATCD